MKNKSDESFWESNIRSFRAVWHGSQHMNWSVRYPMPADAASSEQVEHRLPGVREQIQAAKKETDKPFGVNLMLMNPEADEIAKVIVEEGVKGSNNRRRQSANI